MKYKIKKILYIIMMFVILFPMTSCADNQKSKESYYISDEYFSNTSFEPNTYTRTNLEDGSYSLVYVITFTSLCSVSLYEYTANIELYSNSVLLQTKSITKKKSMSANEMFSFDIEVTQSIQSRVTTASVSFEGRSYFKPATLNERYKVIFVYNNGEKDTQLLIEKGKTVPTPVDPHKTNYLFVGWYTDSSLVYKYDFSRVVINDFTLYAKYEIDALTITNKISNDLIKGVVKVYNKNYDTFLGIETSSSTSQGSGFCFHSQNGNYYILTNCHVAKAKSSYDKQKITIEDYQGKTYEGYIYKSPDKSSSAIDSTYDLACLYFSSNSTNVKPLSINNIDIGTKRDVISIGAPKGQSNSITYGKVLTYTKVTLKDTSTSLSNVTFEVICHDAFINNGSSGGPLLNSDLKVIGVNYAGSNEANYGYAIPARKVKEFLKEYVYS